MNIFHRSQHMEEMDEELLSHVQLRADDLERSGLHRAQAERQAPTTAPHHYRVSGLVHVAICGVGSNVVLRGRDEVRQRCMLIEGHIN